MSLLLTFPANFASNLIPEERDSSSSRKDCVALAHLAHHIVTKEKEMLPGNQIKRQKTLQLNIYGTLVNINPNISSQLLEFLQACTISEDVGQLINVSRGLQQRSILTL